MKNGTIPFPRQFGPGDRGVDCKAVKRALAKWNGGPQGMSLTALTFATPAQKLLKAFKGGHGLLTSPMYTLPAHQALRPFFDEYGASLMVTKAAQVSAQRQRAAYVATWRWFLAHHVAQNYEEVRPIPEYLRPFETIVEIVTDCSGETEIGAKWSGLPDPSRLGFNGEGNTGSLLRACTKIPQARAQPADLIVYRAGAWDNYGHHVVSILEVLHGGQDFEVGSMGHDGDPGQYNHTNMLASQARSGYPLATFLRWLPAV